MEPLIENRPRRSLTRSALTELNETPEPETPKSTSPDEMVIIQRGPRCKPLTWSPYEYNKTNLLAPARDKTPEKITPSRPEINSKLRRRLVMSPEKCSQTELGEAIAKKLKLFSSYNSKNDAID